MSTAMKITLPLASPNVTHPSLCIQQGEKLQQSIFGEPHDDELVADALWATQAEHGRLNIGVTQTHSNSHKVVRQVASISNALVNSSRVTSPCES